MEMASRNRLLLAPLVCVALVVVVHLWSSASYMQVGHNHRTAETVHHREFDDHAMAEGGHHPMMMDAAAAESAAMGGSRHGMRKMKRGVPAQRSNADTNGMAMPQQRQQRQQRARLIVSGADIHGDVPHRHLPQTLRAARRIAADVGGYVAAEASQSSALPSTALLSHNGHEIKAQPGYATLTLKVPAPRLDEAVASLGRIATLTRVQRTAREVTGQVDDLALQLATARSELQRFDALYAATGTMQEKLQLMDRLVHYQETVQRLEDARRRMLTMVDYATIAVRLNERMPQQEHRFDWENDLASPERLAWTVGGATTWCMGVGCLLKGVVVAVRLCLPWCRRMIVDAAHKLETALQYARQQGGDGSHATSATVAASGVEKNTQ